MPTDDNNANSEELTALDLNIQKPFLTHKPLGNKFISPKFLSPLGTKLLSDLETSDRSSTKAAIAPAKQVTNTQKKSTAKTTVIQPQKEAQHQNHNTEIPQLPTRLEKISSLKPLSQTSDFITSTLREKTASLNTSTPPQLQKAATKETPNSWSSIAELVDEMTTVDRSPKTVVQPLKSTRSQYSPQIINSPESSNSSPVIQRYTNSDNSTSIQNIEDTNSEVTITNETSEDESENLEILAREIYTMLQQRLKIEQERRGKNYSGRLPW